jgi:hypothetical protein
MVDHTDFILFMVGCRLLIFQELGADLELAARLEATPDGFNQELASVLLRTPADREVHAFAAAARHTEAILEHITMTVSKSRVGLLSDDLIPAFADGCTAGHLCRCLIRDGDAAG